MDIPQPVTQKLSVPAGQRAHIVLPDGSKVWVNAGSTLTYPSIFGEERRVKLNGEAFFEVAKGTLPFIVSTGKVDIKALGTQFNVFNYPSEELTVALLEGSVRVYHPEQEQQGVLLSPEQQLTATANGRFLVGSTNTHRKGIGIIDTADQITVTILKNLASVLNGFTVCIVRTECRRCRINLSILRHLRCTH